MKKEDILTYLVLWGVLLSICLYLIYTGAPFSIYAKERQALNPETEDIFLYEQLVAENEEQAQREQESLENQVLEENGTAQAGAGTDDALQEGSGDGGTAGDGTNAGAEDAKGTPDGENTGTEGNQNTVDGGSAGVVNSGISGVDGTETAASGQEGGAGMSDSESGQLDQSGALSSGETREVLSNAVAQLSQSGNFLNEYFIVDPDTTLLESEVPADELLNKNMKIAGDAGAPQILIYHTHATEGYADSSDDDVSTTVIGVGDYLEELLTEKYGYNVLHVEEKYDLVEGQLERSRAYNYACDDLEQILAENPSIEVIIDLHRDGVDEDRRLVTDVDGNSTAQIMFFTGLCRTNDSGELTSTPNAYIQDNLAFAAQLEALGDAYYPGYVRGVYVKGYRYNLHLRPKSLLLEVGAQTNTVDEAMNAMVPFADILNKLLKGT